MKQESGAQNQVPLSELATRDTNQVEYLTRRVAELERELIAAEQRNEAWLSRVSHDLRGPLTLIKGYGDILRHHTRASSTSLQRTTEIESILAAASRLDQMLTQVVQGARIEGRHLVPDSQPTDLIVIVREAGRAMNRRYPNHPLDLDLPDSLPLVLCDPGHVATIITSVLANAAQFSPVESPVRVKADVRDERVSVIVEDHGLGLAENELPHIFEPRYRPERALPVRRQGLGISLWIARELARLSGGGLTVTSEGPDRGTTVSLAFPCLRVEPD